MEPKLFHIFRNTPLGRETLMQSIYFCKQIGASPVVYIPEHTRFLMYFENDVIQIDLDASYLTAPETAAEHATQILKEGEVPYSYFKPKNFTASTLPDVPTHFDFMCCPRSISDLSSKIGLGYIGPRVRRIVRSAAFPVIVTSPAYKTWNRIVVFFGGSTNAIKALKLGLRISRLTGKPMLVFTQLEGDRKEAYEKIIEDAGLAEDMRQYVQEWLVFDKGVMEENLFTVPHDALAILGAYGHGLIHDFVFGSKMEKIQSTIANNLLIVGPNYSAMA